MTQIGNPNCYFELEQTVVDEPKKDATVKTITYVQKTKEKLKKSEVELLDKWLAHMEEQ